MLDRRTATVLLPLAVAIAVATPLASSHGAAAATPVLNQCTGTHAWYLPNSVLANAAGTMGETWQETCTTLDPNAAPAPFATVQESPNVNNNPSAAPATFVGNCALMQFTSPAFPDGGFKDIIGNVEIGVGADPNAPGAMVMVGLLVVPSGGVPCQSPTPLTWSGAQSWVRQS